jgi:hypothetical protein
VNVSDRNNDRFTPRDASIKGSGSDEGVVDAGEVDAGTAPHVVKRKGLPGGVPTGPGLVDGVTWGT